MNERNNENVNELQAEDKHKDKTTKDFLLKLGKRSLTLLGAVPRFLFVTLQTKCF